jgi:hypothetical protein
VRRLERGLRSATKGRNRRLSGESRYIIPEDAEAYVEAAKSSNVGRQ